MAVTITELLGTNAGSERGTEGMRPGVREYLVEAAAASDLVISGLQVSPLYFLERSVPRGSFHPWTDFGASIVEGYRVTDQETPLKWRCQVLYIALSTELPQVGDGWGWSVTSAANSEKLLIDLASPPDRPVYIGSRAYELYHEPTAPLTNTPTHIVPGAGRDGEAVLLELRGNGRDPEGIDVQTPACTLDLTRTVGDWEFQTTATLVSYLFAVNDGTFLTFPAGSVQFQSFRVDPVRKPHLGQSVTDLAYEIALSFLVQPADIANHEVVDSWKDDAGHFHPVYELVGSIPGEVARSKFRIYPRKNLYNILEAVGR